jgi:aminopeptidase N
MVAPLAPAALLQSVAENAAQALQYFENLFGPFPYSRLAISQIPGNFGQGWPELVYLPTLSFLRKSERYELGLPEKAEDLLSHGMVAHEIAHQWWGNLLGWKTYHDQWLSEGLATYAAALDLSRQKDGDHKFHGLLRSYKLDLLSKGKSGVINEASGPIWLGQRLSNSLTPGGYDNIVYKKACWVLHMLRGLMSDPSTGSDERFFRLLRDFVATYQGMDVSTEDFMRHAEKYMTRSSDLEHNHRLDWFFNEWVYETGVPTYKLQSSVKQISWKRFLVQGTITQSGVSSDFEMLVPVVAEMGKDKKASLGRVPVSEDGGRFKFTTTERPKRLAIDEDNLLAISER